MDLEIVRPDALKRLMSSVNGRTVIVSTMDLAKKKLNWPKASIAPPETLLKEARWDLYYLLKNPPDNMVVQEVSGSRHFSISIRRRTDAD